MVVELWETVKETITAYTGLSPAAFFTVLALAFAVYQVVSGFFVSPEEHRPRSTEDYPQPEPLPPPVQLGEITEEELKQYDGSDSKKPLLMAIKGQIYDVSQSRFAPFLIKKTIRVSRFDDVVLLVNYFVIKLLTFASFCWSLTCLVCELSMYVCEYHCFSCIQVSLKIPTLGMITYKFVKRSGFLICFCVALV